jgi:hypothetical protein
MAAGGAPEGFAALQSQVREVMERHHPEVRSSSSSWF